MSAHSYITGSQSVSGMVDGLWDTLAGGLNLCECRKR